MPRQGPVHLDLQVLMVVDVAIGVEGCGVGRRGVGGLGVGGLGVGGLGVGGLGVGLTSERWSRPRSWIQRLLRKRRCVSRC